ncbi:MAG TPA: hypothetical protein VF230_01145 [Acidimicrobiales bacterium]
MFARTTLLEIDTMRVPVEHALEVFKDSVIFRLEQQSGFRGLYAFTTPEGRAMLITFWDRADQADASGDAGWYPDVLAEFTTMFRSPPGREHYEVRLALPPAMAGSISY